MAEKGINLRNIVGSKKSTFSSPRTVSLEIEDESSGNASESISPCILFNEQECHIDDKNSSNLICGFDKENYKNFFIHSQSSLSASTCYDRPSDKIKSSNDSDIDLDLLDLLNSVDSERSIEYDVGNVNSKKITSCDKMKISNVKVCDGLADLFSSLAHDISEKDEDGSNFEYCQRKNIRDCDIGLLDCEIVKNEHADFLSSNNSLKVEGNLSDLLSSINIEDSDVLKVGSFNSMNMCNSKVANKFEIVNEPPVADLSDLLSCIDPRDSTVNKVESCNHTDMKVLKSENETCFADLSSIDIGKSDKPTSATLNSKPLCFDSSNLYFKETNGISDSLNAFTFNSGSSSSNSCASSYSEKEITSPKDFSPKHNLTTSKAFAFDSGYSSLDSADKNFSFFDYSSDNQFSFNTLLNKNSDADIAEKHSDSEDTRNSNEEMSMSDLMTIVSPEFKNPVSTTLNKAKRLEDDVCKDSSSMLDLIGCLNINNSHSLRNNSVEYDKLTYDCIDGKISRNGMETINIQGDALVEKDNISIERNNFINDDEHVTLIDLRECIKSAKHQLTPTSPIKQHESVGNQSSECFSHNKILSYCVNKSPLDSSQNRLHPFEFKDVNPRKKSRVNTKQTLFSKALACKPKKDHYLLQKVAIIKNELLNGIIHRPVFIDCDLPQPIVESVLQSDRCII